MVYGQPDSPEPLMPSHKATRANFAIPKCKSRRALVTSATESFATVPPAPALSRTWNEGDKLRRERERDGGASCNRARERVCPSKIPRRRAIRPPARRGAARAFPAVDSRGLEKPSSLGGARARRRGGEKDKRHG